GSFGSAGGLVRGVDGSVVAVVPGSLQTATPVSITPLSQSDLGQPLAEPFRFAAAFHLDVGAAWLFNKAQLSIPVTAVIPAGSEIVFYEAGTAPDTTGNPRPAWFQVDYGIVETGGRVHTGLDPLVTGIHETGNYVVAYAPPGATGRVHGPVLPSSRPAAGPPPLQIGSPRPAPPAPSPPLRAAQMGANPPPISNLWIGLNIVRRVFESDLISAAQPDPSQALVYGLVPGFAPDLAAQA